MRIITKSSFIQKKLLVTTTTTTTMNKLIDKRVNYDFLLSKLKCLEYCPCARFVNSIKVENIEQNPLVWMKIANLNKNEWCPIGPQPLEEYTIIKKKYHIDNKLLEIDEYIQAA